MEINQSVLSLGQDRRRLATDTMKYDRKSISKSSSNSSNKNTRGQQQPSQHSQHHSDLITSSRTRWNQNNDNTENPKNRAMPLISYPAEQHCRLLRAAHWQQLQSDVVSWNSLVSSCNQGDQAPLEHFGYTHAWHVMACANIHGAFIHMVCMSESFFLRSF